MKESVEVPVVANGDIKNEEDIQRVAEMTNVDGMYHNITDTIEKALYKDTH